MDREDVVKLKQESLKNLYAFVGNAPNHNFDFLGLAQREQVYKRMMGSFFSGDLHYFLEFYGESVGYSPGDNPFGGGGVVSVPDLWGHNKEKGWNKGSKRIAQLWIEGCCVDVEKFRKAIKKVASAAKNTDLTYCYGLYDCRHFIDTVVAQAAKESVKEDRPWWCRVKGHYGWGKVQN
jgi:hypothetical protein